MKKKLHILILLIVTTIAVSAQTRHLWITASDGGSSNDGTILMADSAGNNWQVVATFLNYNGSYPQATLLLGADHHIYGTTRRGGVSDSCTIFKLDTGTHVITKVHDFMSSPSQGAIPYSGMILTSDCDMYGLTFDGGSNGSGVIYLFDPSGNFYVDLYNFSTATGSRPFGELLELSNGLLYGMTSAGGTNGEGVIFSFDPFGWNYTVIYNFSYATGGAPAYGNLIQATNGKLYGLAYEGGANGDGAIFSYDLTTSTYANLHNFDNGVDGTHPFGSLMQAGNGKLYGMTIGGGPGAKGTFFSYDILTGTFNLLVSFNGANGDYPQRGLKEVSNGKLMGTTMKGGLFDQGIIYTYDIPSATFTKIFDFDGTTTGGHPTSDIFMTGGPQTIPCLVGINTPAEDTGFLVYPVPAQNGTFMIQFNEASKQVELSIYDISMRKVYFEVINDVAKSSTKEIKADLPKGVYILNLKSGEKVLTRKLTSG